MVANEIADIVYQMSFEARTGMGDALDYGVVMEIMNQLGLEGPERAETMQKIMAADAAVREQSHKNAEEDAKRNRQQQTMGMIRHGRAIGSKNRR